MTIRLNKLMAERGLGARRKCDALIEAGAVRLNGVLVTKPGVQIDPERDSVEVNGRPLPREAALAYYVFHKPVGVISTLSDPEGRRTLRDFMPPGRRMFPVGRLDADTSGLLLLTNDGNLAHHLMHPRYGVTKAYRVHADRAPTAHLLKRLAAGIEFEPGIVSAPALVRVLDETPGDSVIEITIHEGRYRQVRRMAEAAGLHVHRLHRWAYGPLRLGDLARGMWRELSESEVASLRAVSARARPRGERVPPRPPRTRGRGAAPPPAPRYTRAGAPVRSAPARVVPARGTPMHEAPARGGSYRVARDTRDTPTRDGVRGTRDARGGGAERAPSGSFRGRDAGGSDGPRKTGRTPERGRPRASRAPGRTAPAHDVRITRDPRTRRAVVQVAPPRRMRMRPGDTVPPTRPRDAGVRGDRRRISPAEHMMRKRAERSSAPGAPRSRPAGERGAPTRAARPRPTLGRGAAAGSFRSRPAVGRGGASRPMGPRGASTRPSARPRPAFGGREERGLSASRAATGPRGRASGMSSARQGARPARPGAFGPPSRDPRPTGRSRPGTGGPRASGRGEKARSSGGFGPKRGRNRG